MTVFILQGEQQREEPWIFFQVRVAAQNTLQ